MSTLLGWILLKYLLLGNVTFEASFKYGFLYHGTALLTLSVLSTANGIRVFDKTPDFLEGFKHIAKTVMVYAIGATLSVGIWHNFLMKDATHARLQNLKLQITNNYSSEEEYLANAKENGLPSDLSLSEWITSQHEAADIFYSAKTQISLTLMVYLVVGLFMSFVASLLWTKVWGVQQIKQNSR
ncbi:MAG: hypothetical protein COA49_05240 [Bacteroidetes bacterium]|nr:MAG: hypothetical protein COA49_05240 [Bacteroidota bacterium]